MAAPVVDTGLVQAVTPYVMFVLSMVSGLLALVYWHMRDLLGTQQAAIDKLQTDLKSFREKDVKELYDRIAQMNKEVLEAVHRVELAMASNFVTKVDLAHAVAAKEH